MEKIKVNMTPNPLDVQTIHASQNDGEARQWEFELHNNGELIDTSNVTEQLFFKTYKGGTEQILPENTSTPTTSPFKGDIKYPQGLLTDQEFTYRESPAIQDGLARIDKIKGNTLMWNQLLNISVETSTVNGITYTINGDGSISISGTATAQADKQIAAHIPFISGHKYLLTGGQSANLSSNANAPQNWKNSIRTDRANGTIIECINSYTGTIFLSVTNGATINTKITPMLLDLTKMGLDISSPSDFTSLFPLSYYSYNQGSLLSFNGNGIKTVGKNLCTRTNQNSNIYNAGNLIRVKQGQTIYWGGVWTYTSSGGKFWPAVYSDPNETNKNNYISYGGSDPSGVVNSYTVQKDGYLGLAYGDGVSSYNVEKMMISYVPFTIDEIVDYTSSTTSLPISTYFPTGMKSAGTVYDELTETKAITRIGAINLGSLTWQYYSGRSNFYAIIPDVAVPTNANIKANAKCILGEPITWNEMLANANENGTYAVMQYNTEKRFYIKNTNYSSVADFMQYVNGVYLYYELATPTETPFTTASLVTENADIPLSNEDGVLLGKCTEQLSENPGFIDAKIKLSDADGECYSNKIQLHIERSPQ